MSNKEFQKLNPIDKAIRIACPTGMCDKHTELTIEFIQGFELFNTRPYHNYETWSDGYRISGKGIVIEREDLDDAVAAWIKEKERKDDLHGSKQDPSIRQLQSPKVQ